MGGRLLEQGRLLGLTQYSMKINRIYDGVEAETRKYQARFQLAEHKT